MVTLEERAEDVGAVMRAARSEYAAFVGWADGGGIGAMFAAMNPERISALVLSAMGFVTTPAAIGADPAMMQLMWETIEQGWGSGSLLDLTGPRHASDQRLRRWCRRWERQSATPNAAATMLRWAAEADLRPVFQAVQAPTPFLERADADTIDPQSVCAAAALTPQGRYVEIPGDDLLPFLGDPEPMLGEIEEFLTGARGSVDPDRTLSTVLFTDIVGSTEKADRVGDREWRNLLDSHHWAVRALLDRYGGVEIDTAGDGFLATFSGPARAVRCACDIRNTVRDLGLEIRAGLHTGEVERRQDSVSGLAVHIGARVAAQAVAGEVLVTSIVKALVLGSGLSFADRGTHSLKGVTDTWQLFAAM
jgi:class 3 adenylate cyclase